MVRSIGSEGKLTLTFYVKKSRSLVVGITRLADIETRLGFMPRQSLFSIRKILDEKCR